MVSTANRKSFFNLVTLRAWQNKGFYSPSADLFRRYSVLPSQ
jgi:hypothetical protein